MHSTSPGADNSNSMDNILNELEFKKIFCQNECIQKTTSSTELKNAIDNTSLSFISDDFNQRIYDDPCDLLDSVANSPHPTASPIFHLPRSSSWLCCSKKPEIHSDPINFQTNYQLVTDQPKQDIHIAAFSALNSEIIELRERLQKSDVEKEELKIQVKELYDDKNCTQRHLEAITNSYDSRITEMHSVIIELNKKLKVQQDKAIIEENEGSVSELSFQEGSVYNSDIDTANYERESETHEMEEKPIQEMIESVHTQKTTTTDPPKLHQSHKQSSPSSLPTPNYSSQIQGLQEEILHLRAQIALLQSELSSYVPKEYNEHINDEEEEFVEYEEGEEEETQENNEIMKSSITNQKTEDNENDKSIYTSEEQGETVEIEALQLSSEFTKITTAQCRKTNNVVCSPSKHSLPTSRPAALGNSYKTTNAHTFEQPIAKIAERVKLKRTMEDNFIAGNELTSSGIYTTEIAEHLVSDFMQSETTNMASTNELQSEIQRLQRRIEHLKLQNSVITLTLQESKQHCNQLYLLCGKYESNALALQQALNCSDRAIEAYDVMLALLESKLAMLESEDLTDDSRKAAESVAHLLLERLNCETSLHGKSLAPWQEAVVILPESEEKPWTEDHDRILRNHVSKLKGQRSFIQNTVVTLESPFYSENREGQSPPSTKGSRSRSKCMDLETAVLMQELMSMREDMSELKYQAEQSEKEKNLAYEKLKALQTVLIESEALLALNNNAKDRFSYSEAEHNASIERELLEALGRESRLKARLQGLALSLESAARLSEERHNQVQNTVSELKQTNLNLSQSLERCKRKYQSRIKRLEQQLLGMKFNPTSTQPQSKNSLTENQLKAAIVDINASCNNTANTDTKTDSETTL